MKRYVMFGHGHLFGELLEIIHVNDGVLTKVVQNMAEVPHPNRPSLQERLERLRDSSWNAAKVNGDTDIEVVPLENFEPGDEDGYLIGFTGVRIAPLADALRERFGIRFEPLVHPSAVVSPTARLAEGVVINAGVIIGSGCSLEEHVIVNRSASIGHDVTVSPYAVVQPGANIAGQIRLGKGCLIGIGATVIEDRVVGELSIVAAGAVVIDDVPARTMVAGVPATPKKRCNEEVK